MLEDDKMNAAIENYLLDLGKAISERVILQFELKNWKNSSFWAEITTKISKYILYYDSEKYYNY